MVNIQVSPIAKIKMHQNIAAMVESRQDHRPMPSDLRESGSIEQDADIILFIYREAMYDKQNPNQSAAECIIAKNRHGSTGTVNLAYLGEYTLFRSVDTKREQ